ncbi:PLP-dependent aminotransferase family protein [Saccharothrix sp. Mg75]|uniref:aminotransferase-like domain-containing protein n=1 Tax=Saccharothrix sp. Mg75 TaxID=3445357 RepID=UPI003EEF9400
MSALLSIPLDRSAPESMTHQIRDTIRGRIRDGTLRPGSRLPSSRRLADDLGVSRSVVVQAYEQMIAEGYLTAEQGSGTRVAVHVPTVPAAPAEAPVAVPRTRFDLRPDATGTDLFPARRWLMSYQNAVHSAARGRDLRRPPAGVAELRVELADYLGRARGVVGGEVIVTAGFTDAVALAASALRDLGVAHAAVETPGDQRLAGTLAGAGLRVTPVPVDREGVDVAALTRSGARAVLVTPLGQVPTGSVLSPARRAALARWSDAVDGWVIEHDPDGHLWLGRGAAQLAVQRDRPGRVLYTGATMGLFGPCLRLGWLVVPPALFPRFHRALDGRLAGPDALTQAAFADFLSRGLLDQHVRDVRATLRARRSALRELVGEHLPGAVLRGGDAGSHSWLALPPEVDDARVAETAGRHSVVVRTGGSYRLDRRPVEPALVLGYRAVDQVRLASAVAVLGWAVERSADLRVSSA